MRTMQLVGAMLILVGLLFALNVISLATLVVDTTPPNIMSTVPAADQVYVSIDKATAHVTDDISGVKQVVFYLYDFQSSSYIYNAKFMTLTSGNNIDGTWEYTFSSTLATPGKYAVLLRAQDNAANVKDSGWINFTIYSQLQGKWYINDQEITNTSQTVYSKSTSITFKFVKTAGVVDQSVTVKVSGSSPTRQFTYGVDHISEGVWESTWTLEPAVWTITLQASDGIRTITYSMVNLQIGEQSPPMPLPSFSSSQMLGVVLIAVGAVLALGRKMV
jgi:hypothetical protein